MADTDDKNAAAANVQADAIGAQPASSRDKVTSKGKGALRRKMVGLGQTSLSSHSPVMMPGSAQLSQTSQVHAAQTEPELVEPIVVAPVMDVALVEAALESADMPIAKRKAGRPRKEQAAPALVEVGSMAAKLVASTQPIAENPVAAVPADIETAPIEMPAAEQAMDPVAASPMPDEATLAPAEPEHAVEIAEPIMTADTTQSSVPSIKDMTMDMSANFNGFQGAMSEAQAKAQAAFEKSSTLFNEAGDFAKGNVEAMVESTKILAEGVKGMGSNMVSEGRTAFEAMTADVKELVAVKSPTDFFKLQSEMVRKNFDSAVAQSSKNTETFLKLLSDAFAPVSGRVSLAVEKARQVAPMNTAVTANV